MIKGAFCSFLLVITVDGSHGGRYGNRNGRGRILEQVGTVVLVMVAATVVVVLVLLLLLLLLLLLNGCYHFLFPYC